MPQILNRELISDLKDSRKDGELYPLIDGRFPDGKLKRISGFHRAAAGWKSKKIIPVKNELEFLKLQLAAQVQRKSSFEEQALIIRKICEYFQQVMEKDKIANHVAKNVRGITQSYLYEMIPDEYKKGRSQGESAKLKAAGILATIPNLESSIPSSKYSDQHHPLALPPSDRLVPRTNPAPDRILRMPCAHEGCSKPLYVNVTKQEAYHKES